MSIGLREGALRNDVRQPRLRVLLRGNELNGVLAAEVENNSHFAADRFRVQFASSAVQQNLLHIPGVQVEIELSVGVGWHSQIVGLIDTVSFDPVLAVVSIEGRDLSSQLIETQMEEAFANRTASEIALLIGLRHGLIVLADPTFTPIGRYYQSEHDRTTLSQFAKAGSEWDLLAILAIREGFDLYVTGRTLRFGVPNFVDVTNIPLADCVSVHLDHAVGLARPINVLVRSWSSRSGEVATGNAFAFGVGPVWDRRITRPNLTSSDAQEQAARFVDDLKRHEWTATVTMPGDVDLDVKRPVRLQGIGAQWDRVYRIVQSLKRIDVKRGFIQTLSLQGMA